MKFFRKFGLSAFAMFLALVTVLNPYIQSQMIVKATASLSLSAVKSMAINSVKATYPNADVSYKYYVVVIKFSYKYDANIRYDFYAGDNLIFYARENGFRLANYKFSSFVYYDSKTKDYSASSPSYSQSNGFSTSTDFGSDTDNVFTIKGYYPRSDGIIVDTEKPVINYQDYYCVYTFDDGTSTNSSNDVKNRELGGGASRGGGAGRDVDENGKTKPVITDEDTYGETDEKPVDKKYYRVCYDKDTSTWQPHGTIQIVNNTIINNTYIVTDGTEEPATGSDIPPSDDWPADTPSWIEFLGNLISGLLQGLGDAIGGLGSAIGGIANALGNVISSLIEALTDLFKSLFVPSGEFLQNSFTGIKDNFELKFPFLDQANEAENSIIGTIQGADSTAPTYEVTLPDVLGGGTVQMFDFSFFEQYRDLIHGGILFFAWATFIMRLPHKLSKAIGGLN